MQVVVTPLAPPGRLPNIAKKSGFVPSMRLTKR